MESEMRCKFLSGLSALLLLAPALAVADDLTRMIQEDLARLGYEPGPATGEASTETIVAISKFQAEHDLEVSGEVSPQLAGIIKAAIDDAGQAAAHDAPPPGTAVRSAEALQSAQQACLQEKVEKAQAAQKTRRGLGSLMRAVSRTASQVGNNDVAQKVGATTSDVYNANATAADLESAAKDLGLSESDVEACRNP
jgi:peptidoglycan hydrolase-like protein with peptidoglycan-binding domain